MTHSLPAGALPFIAAAVIVFSTVAMANVPVTGWLDGMPQRAHRLLGAYEPAPEAQALPARREIKTHRRTRCEGCGVVQAIQHIDALGDTPESYEFTVRLHDGSTRVSTEASQAKWRAGDNIILIGGTNLAGQLNH